MLTRYLLRVVRLSLVLLGLAVGGCGQKPKAEPAAAAAPAIPAIGLGETVVFGLGGTAGPMLGAGWSHPEAGFIWTEGDVATLTFRVPAPGSPLTLEMMLAGMVKPPVLLVQPVSMRVNGEALTDWQVGDKALFRATIPSRLIPADGVLKVTLGMPKAAVPAELGLGADPRRLGVQVSSLRVAAGSATAAATAGTAAGPDHRYEPGSVVRFGAGQEGERYEVSGWQPAEAEFTWTMARAALQFELASAGPGAAPSGRLTLRAKLSGLFKVPELPAQPVEVSVNGKKVADWLVGETDEFRVELPADLTPVTAGGRYKLDVEFNVPRATTPQALGLGNDPRTLGVRCSELTLEPVKS